MALHYTGKILGITTENVTSRDGSFADFLSTTIHVLDGVKSEEIRVGRDFPKADLGNLAEGDLVDLEVFPSKGRLYAVKVREHVAA